MPQQGVIDSPRGDETPATGLVRLYVWELPVRLAHWVIFLAVLVLAFTGYYMYNPFVIARGETVWMMGTMRFIHEVAGFALICALIVRVYWMFAGNRWSRWTQFIPTNRHRVTGLFQVLKYYLFFRWRMPRYIDHNPLAGFTYTGVYLVLIVEALTGLALFNFIVKNRFLGWGVDWITAWLGTSDLRLLHFALMFVIVVFVLHHVYSAVIVAAEEKMGLMGSIFSGYKFVPRWLIQAHGEPPLADEKGPAPPASRPVPPSSIGETTLP